MSITINAATLGAVSEGIDLVQQIIGVLALSRDLKMDDKEIVRLIEQLQAMTEVQKIEFIREVLAVPLKEKQERVKNKR